jgi:hypothetical protein
VTKLELLKLLWTDMPAAMEECLMLPGEAAASVRDLIEDFGILLSEQVNLLSRQTTLDHHMMPGYPLKLVRGKRPGSKTIISLDG